MGNLTFPNAPSPDDTYTDDNSVVWTWNGESWISAGAVGTEALAKDGSVALTANWDAGNYKITANQLELDGLANVASANVTGDLDVGGTATVNGNVVLDAGDIGGSVQAYDADTLKADTSDQLQVGYSSVVYDNGEANTGTFTPNETNGALQKVVNGGAHTLAPPANNCTLIVQYTNAADAGTITTSGFTKVDGTFTTTNGDDFMCFIAKVGTFSHLNIVKLQ